MTHSPSTPAKETDHKSGGKRHQTPLIRRIVLVALALLIVLIGVVAARLALQGWNAYRSAREIERILQSGMTTASLPRLQAEVDQISKSAANVSRQIAPFAPILKLGDGITVYGNTVAALPDLVDVGSKMSAVGDRALALLTPALVAEGGDLNLEALASALSTPGTDLAQLAPALGEAGELLRTIDAEKLHPAIAQRLADLQSVAPVLTTGIELAPLMAELLGYNGPKSYLILIQNNHELRATGGFISSVGRLTLEDGEIFELDFVDSYQIYNQEGDYPAAPEPMQTYMKIPLMLFRDANWSPDLPTSAQLAQSLYLQETGVQVDGIITIDLHAVEKLVGAMGPLQVAGVEERITGKNIVSFIKDAWAAPLTTDATIEDSGEWWANRKEFVPALADAAFQRLESGNVNFIALAKAGLLSLNGRSIQLWLDDADAALALANLGWDGRIAPLENADFLALIDTNMGYNKVNAVVEKELRYSVEWPDGGQEPAIATATVRYHHPVEKADHVCDQAPRYGEDYDEMMARCYFNYVRLYVPVGSRLIDARGFQLDSVTSRRGERGTQVFSGWFVLPPGQDQTISFLYELPDTITEEGYQLVVQRQSGTETLPFASLIGNHEVEQLIEESRFIWPGTEE